MRSCRLRSSINIVIPLVQSYNFLQLIPCTDVNLEGKTVIDKISKRTPPLSLSLSLSTGRSADALVKLIFPERELSLSLSLSHSLSLSQLFTFANDEKIK